MSIQDEDFIKRLRATFKVEAEEHLSAASSILLELEKSPAPARRATVIEEIFRAAHSLKGAARAVDLNDIEAICQALESVFAGWKRQKQSPPAEAFDTLHRALDMIRALVVADPSAEPAPERDELIKSVLRLQSRTSPAARQKGNAAGAATATPPVQPAPSLPATSVPEASTTVAASPPPAALASAASRAASAGPRSKDTIPPSEPGAAPAEAGLTENSDDVAPDASSARPALAASAASTPPAGSTAALPAKPTSAVQGAEALPGPVWSVPADSEKPAIPDTVRISVAKLDAGLLQAEDMLVVKAMVAERARDLRGLTEGFDHWHKEWAKVSSEARSLRQTLERQESNPGVSRGVGPSVALVNFLDWNWDYLRSLENKLVTLSAHAEQDRHQVARRVDDLLEDSKKLLMLPFSTLADGFPKLVRDLCRDQGKEADLVVRGGDVEIDKRILEGTKDAIIHVLRNCVDHGVEKPAERAQRNKPARATITISVSQVNGNKVEILISDDGAGVDVGRVKASAVRQGIISESAATSLSQADALALIFHSEVSTSPIVTAISGRGLGMAIARTQTEKLGGQASIDSQRHAGTNLRMVLPLTLATFRGVLISVAGRIFVAPTVNVERVLRLQPRDIQSVENRETISVQGRVVSLARLDAVLELQSKPIYRDDAAAVSVMILQSADQRIAFVVDDILHEEEVLVKPLHKPLVRIRNIAGATVLGSGRAVPVLNVSDLIKSARAHGAVMVQASPAARAPVETPGKHILVVEDSITSRMLLKGILESAGFKVKTAVDGVDGFTALREDHFDLVVSDVEMPRMNGFDLTGRIRGDRRLANLPVVLVTALESREEREQGIDAGANAYIVKRSFDQGNLLEIVRRLI